MLVANIYIYLMSEEKIRNYKAPVTDTVNSDSIPSFLLKTYQILENSKYSDIICWTKSGEGFVVKKVKQFAQTILPTHFRHSNYTSFVRQLNMYDFHKTRQQNQQNAFKNSMFKRGQKNLLKQIQRKDYKKKKEKPQNVQKVGTMIDQNEIKNTKKMEHEKQFYTKGLNVLSKINEEMNTKQGELAQIEDKDVQQSDEYIAQLLQMIYKIKSHNNNWYGKLANLGKQWQVMLNAKKTILKQEIQSEKSFDAKKEQTGPTMPSFQSFTNQN